MSIFDDEEWRQGLLSVGSILSAKPGQGGAAMMQALLADQQRKRDAEDRQRKLKLEEMQLADYEAQREAKSKFGALLNTPDNFAGSATYGMSPEEKNRLMASTAFSAGFPGLTKDYLSANSVQPKTETFGTSSGYAINPETGKADYFTTSKDGNIRWLETEGKPVAPKNDDGYFTPVATKDGYRVFDHRSGKFTSPEGQQIIRPGDSPSLQKGIIKAKEIGKDEAERLSTVPTKQGALEAIRDGREMLKKGIYSGFWGPAKLAVIKATPGLDKEKAANTEAYLSYIGNVVIPRLSEFGGNDSVEEMRYLQKVMAGDIRMEAAAMERILRSAEEKLQRKIERIQSEDGSSPSERPPLGSFFR